MAAPSPTTASPPTSARWARSSAAAPRSRASPGPPDLCPLGKILGGGFPLAAIAGRADIMAHFDKGIVGEDGFLMQVGTLSGNPVASVAGLATLAVLRRPGAYEQVFASGRRLMAGIEAMLKKAGLPAQIVGEP